MSMSLRTFLGSKRKSSNNNSSTLGNSSTQSPPPNQSSISASPRSSQANSSTSSLPTQGQPPAPTANTNNMNPNAGGLGRPPSYTYAANGAPQLGAPGSQHRSNSPMPPPPINTATNPAGYPPQQIQPQYGQQQQGPPGYGAPPPPNQGGYGQPQSYQPPVPQGPGSYARPGPAEVDGGARSKAQLIVGIDFVGYGSLFWLTGINMSDRAPPSLVSPLPLQPIPRPRRT